MTKSITKKISLLLIFILIIFSASVNVNASSPSTVSASAAKQQYGDLTLLAGGMPFGVKFVTEGVLVVGSESVKMSDGSCDPAKSAGLQPNDIILQINGHTLTSAIELNQIVEGSGGAPLKIIFSRNGHQKSTTLTPAYCEQEGRYSAGLYVRDSGAGIGTVTFIVPKTGAFAGLGHGICDCDTGKLVPMQRGSVVGVTISGVVRGLSGSPGEIKGYFSSGKTGSLLGNTDCGVFGVFATLPKDTPATPMPVGTRKEVKTGKACILCTLDSNKIEQYEIEISDIKTDSTSNKCFTVKVTDERLLDKTGGIIQGMSGSPIIQNGKLIGAVTHVLIGDPACGYGIFIENMLAQMGDLAA